MRKKQHQGIPSYPRTIDFSCIKESYAAVNACVESCLRCLQLPIIPLEVIPVGGVSPRPRTDAELGDRQIGATQLHLLHFFPGRRNALRSNGSRPKRSPSPPTKQREPSPVHLQCHPKQSLQTLRYRRKITTLSKFEAQNRIFRPEDGFLRSEEVDFDPTTRI